MVAGSVNRRSADAVSGRVTRTCGPASATALSLVRSMLTECVRAITTAELPATTAIIAPSHPATARCQRRFGSLAASFSPEGLLSILLSPRGWRRHTVDPRVALILSNEFAGEDRVDCGYNEEGHRGREYESADYRAAERRVLLATLA